MRHFSRGSGGFKTPLAYCDGTTTSPRATGCRGRVCVCAFVGEVTGLLAASINCPFLPALNPWRSSVYDTAAASFHSVSPVEANGYVSKLTR